MHGDYRLDNALVDDRARPASAAVLDWEMSTLGDPLTDLGLFVVYASGRPGDDCITGDVTQPRPASRPTDGSIARYARAHRHRRRPRSDWYVGFALLQARRDLGGHPLPLHARADRRAPASSRSATGVARPRRATAGRAAPERRDCNGFRVRRRRPRSCTAELLDFMDEHVYPAEAVYAEQVAARDRPVGSRRRSIEDLKAEAPQAGPVEPVPARRARRRPDQPAVRAAGRDHRPQPARWPRRRSTAPRRTPATWRC